MAQWLTCRTRNLASAGSYTDTAHGVIASLSLHFPAISTSSWCTQLLLALCRLQDPRGNGKQPPLFTIGTRDLLTRSRVLCRLSYRAPRMMVMIMMMSMVMMIILGMVTMGMNLIIGMMTITLMRIIVMMVVVVMEIAFVMAAMTIMHM